MFYENELKKKDNIFKESKEFLEDEYNRLKQYSRAQYDQMMHEL